MDDAAPRDRIDYKTGIIIQEDASYGEHWRFNSTGNISFELDADEWNELVSFVSEKWDLDTASSDGDISERIEDGLNAGIELIRMTQIFKV